MIKTEQLGPILRISMPARLLGRRVHSVCAFYIDGLLIDSGFARARQHFWDCVAGLGVVQLVNTHHHEDHVGNNQLLAERLGVRPQIHPAGLEPAGIGQAHLHAYRRVIWGCPEPVRPVPLGEEVKTDHYTFKVIHTPGHSVDHVCLYEEREGWLFTGDLFLSERVRVMRADEALGDLLQSLQRIAEVDARRLYCSHGRIIDNPQRAIREKIMFYQELIEQAEALHQSGLSAVQIRRRLLGREGAFWLLSRGHFSKQNLIDEVLNVSKMGLDPTEAYQWQAQPGSVTDRRSGNANASVANQVSNR